MTVSRNFEESFSVGFSPVVSLACKSSAGSFQLSNCFVLLFNGLLKSLDSPLKLTNISPWFSGFPSLSGEFYSTVFSQMVSYGLVADIVAQRFEKVSDPSATLTLTPLHDLLVEFGILLSNSTQLAAGHLVQEGRVYNITLTIKVRQGKDG